MDNKLENDAMYVGNPNHWWFSARAKIVTDIIESRIKNMDNGILDFGCGPGYMYKYLSKYGEVAGADANKTALEICEKNTDMNLHNCDFEKGYDFGKRFNIIIALDVIEHLNNSVSALKMIRDALSDDGFAIITVPAFNFMWTTHDNNSGHKRRYTKSSLTAWPRTSWLAKER